MPASHARVAVADPSGLDDLEAELRRMEEELAALKGKKPEKKAKRKEAPPTEVASEAAPAVPPEAPKKRFGLPKFGKKGEAPVPDPVAAESVAPEAALAPPPAEAAREPAQREASRDAAVASTPSGRWRREGRVWVLQNPPREPVHLRRVLDADGRVVREEPAPPEMFAPRAHTSEAATAEAIEVPPAPQDAPEKPLHSLAERLGAKRKRGLFGRKKGD